MWYLLYSGRNAYHKDFVKEYKILKESLQKHNNFPIMSSFSKKLNGESLKDRLSVFVFRILEKCHLLSVFSLIYCRGGKE